MSTVTMIKKEAQIPLTVGSGFFQKIQQTLVALVAERSPEELDEFTELMKNQQELPESWMDNIVTLSTLVQEIEKSAIASGNTYEQSEDVISSLGS